MVSYGAVLTYFADNRRPDTGSLNTAQLPGLDYLQTVAWVERKTENFFLSEVIHKLLTLNSPLSPCDMGAAEPRDALITTLVLPGLLPRTTLDRR